MIEEPLGRDLLLEVGLSFVEGIMPSIDTNDYDRLSQCFTDFLSEKKNFDECSNIFSTVLGRDDPLVRVNEIINIPDEPIVYSEEAQAMDENPHNRKKTRTWGGYEDQRLIAGVYKYGLDNWPMVAQFVGSGRTRAQCAQRWARGLNPRICKKHWSHAEDEQLKQLVHTYGEKSWTKIAAAFGNRSDVQCRYHYRQLVKGDDLPGVFMSLRRGTPVALSTQAFYNPQFPQMVQPQVFIMPTVPMMNQAAMLQQQQQQQQQQQHQQQQQQQQNYAQPGFMALGPTGQMRMSSLALPTGLMEMKKAANYGNNHFNNNNLNNMNNNNSINLGSINLGNANNDRNFDNVNNKPQLKISKDDNVNLNQPTTPSSPSPITMTAKPPPMPNDAHGLDTFLSHFKL